VSCDGTDFKIAEQGPAFSSHKFAKKSGLRYEVCVCILSGDIVWVNGPFPCGRNHDITIFRKSLISHLGDNERVEADDGYIGEHPRYVKCPKGFTNPPETEAMQQRVRNRQETANKRFKDWGCLRQKWRHHIPDHGDAFRAVAMLTQLSINNGEKLFLTGYKDPPYTNNVFDVASDEELDES
jgi:DDE superfamily endonuclease